MKNVTTAKQSPLKVVVIILAVIVVVLYGTAILSINETARGLNAEYDARDYLYSAEHGRYGNLYDTTLRDMGKKTTYSAEVEECRALAFYYEQAVLEHAYRVTGKTDKADAFAARMKEYESELGSLAKRAADVRAVVNEG